MSTANLTESAPSSAVLDGAGKGTAKIGPAGPQERWTVSRVHVKTNQLPTGITNEAQCFVYAGPAAADQYFVDSTSSGSTGDSTDSADSYELGYGDFIWAVWLGGDPGAQGVVRVTGTKTV